MKLYRIRIEVTAHTDDSSGREFVRFTPFISARPLASGEWSMAVWEAWLDEPETIQTQRAACVASVHKGMTAIVSDK